VLGDQTTTAVEFSNSFDVGSIAITKIVDGPGAASFGTGPFEFAVTCVLTDESGERTVWDGTVSLGGGDPLTASIDNLADGAVCDITESGTGGADASVVSPEQLTVGADEPALVTATNTFLAGSIHLEKERIGDGADLYGVGPFQVSAACVQRVDGQSVAVDIPGGPDRDLSEATGYVADYELLPTGSVCVLSESGTGGATDSSIVNDAGAGSRVVVVRDNESVSRAIVNDFRIGSIRVDKNITGDPSAAEAQADFTVRLRCLAILDGVESPVDIPDGADRLVSASTDAIYESLPVGARCTVTETDDGGAQSIQLTPGDGEVVVGDGTEVTVTVQNRFAAVSAGQLDPSDLAPTGQDLVPMLVLASLCLGMGLVLRRRSSAGKQNAT